MKAVLLAAGNAQRLKGVVDNIPKPMVQIAGKPILQHNLEWLGKFGVTDIYINIHHLPDIITSHFGDGTKWGVRITYSREQQLLGTAGAVKKIARDFWKDGPVEPFLVVYGDNLVTDFDLNRIIQFHNRKKGIAAICLYHNPEEVSKSGVVLLDGQGRVLKFVEKPYPRQVQSSLVNTGVYVLEPVILNYIPTNCLSDFGKDVFPTAIDAGESLFGLVVNADLIAIDTPQLYKKLVVSKVNR